MLEQLERVNQQKAETGYVYSTILDCWLHEIKDRLKASSYAKYCNIINNHIRPSMGDMLIKNINSATVKSVVFKKLGVGLQGNTGSLSEKTVRDILSVIKSTIRFAIDGALIPNVNIVLDLPKGYKKNIRILSKAEQIALEQYLFNDIDICKMGVLLSLYTGIRIGELCALKWCDFDFRENAFSISRTLQRVQCFDSDSATKTMVVESSPKSACSIRVIPLPTFIAEELQQFRPADDDVNFLTGASSHAIEPRTLQNKFKKYTVESGISVVNFHAIRHTFATRCVEIGFDIKSLSEILGHSNVNITLNRYVHPSIDMKRSNMKKLRKLFLLNAINSAPYE